MCVRDTTVRSNVTKAERWAKGFVMGNRIIRMGQMGKMVVGAPGTGCARSPGRRSTAAAHSPPPAAGRRLRCGGSALGSTASWDTAVAPPARSEMRNPPLPAFSKIFDLIIPDQS